MLPLCNTEYTVSFECMRIHAHVNVIHSSFTAQKYLYVQCMCRRTCVHVPVYTYTYMYIVLYVHMCACTMYNVHVNTLLYRDRVSPPSLPASLLPPAHKCSFLPKFLIQIDSTYVDDSGKTHNVCECQFTLKPSHCTIYTCMHLHVLACIKNVQVHVHSCAIAVVFSEGCKVSGSGGMCLCLLAICVKVTSICQ